MQKKGQRTVPNQNSFHLQDFLIVSETITFIVQTKTHQRVKGGDIVIKGQARMTDVNLPRLACVYIAPSFALHGKEALEQRSPRLKEFENR